MGYSGPMRSALTVVVALVVGLAAGGCHRSSPESQPESRPQSPSSSSAQPAGTGSAADIAFLQDVAVHHQQALELTAMVPGQSSNPALVALAEQIAAQQRTELQGCQAQLLQWEVPGATPKRPGSAPDTPDVPGMLGQPAIDELRSLHGPAFDKLWLQSMIAHHRGAITLAHNEIENGQSPDAVSIAQSLAVRQQTQIDQLNQLLEDL